MEVKRRRRGPKNDQKTDSKSAPMWGYRYFPPGNYANFFYIDAWLASRNVEAYFYPLYGGDRIYRISLKDGKKLIPVRGDSMDLPYAIAMGEDQKMPIYKDVGYKIDGWKWYPVVTPVKLPS